MNVLIAGATGATGRLLTEQLLERGHTVTVVVRSPQKLPDAVRNHENLSVVQASLLELTDAELAELVNGCDAVASCLGHNMSFQGMYGHPRWLVTDAVRRLSQAIHANESGASTKFVLMNTAGNQNRDLGEPISAAQSLVLSLLRRLVPPHVDNEEAADYLRTQVGQRDETIQWAVVRPDNLLDAETVTDYDLHPSPTRSAIFDPGKTSRINVAHFMAELITENECWLSWQGQMPVIYNREAVAV